MKLSFWTLGTPDWSNETVVEAAKRFGYQGVDLRCAPGRNISVQSTNQEIDDLRRLFDNSGIEIASLLAYNLRGNEEGVTWDDVAADIVAHARLANRLGTHGLRVNAASPRDGNWQPYLEGFARALTSALAQSNDVVFNIQNHPGAPSAAQMTQLATMVNDSRFGLGFSPDHCIDMDEDAIAAAEKAAPHVTQFHLADRERLADGRLKACLPGAGFVPNREVLDILGRHGYDGWVSFKWEKPTYPDLPDAEIALPHFIDFMSKLD